MYGGYSIVATKSVSNLDRTLRIGIMALAGLIALCAPRASGQTSGQTTSTRVYTEPAGLPFYVDGQVFTSTAMFTWPVGSRHTVTTSQLITGLDAGTTYSFGGWSDTSGLIVANGSTATFTADAKITSLVASFTKSYEVKLNFFQCPSGSCQGPATVYVNSAPYTSNTTLLVSAGAEMTLGVITNPGFVFLGWNYEWAVPNQVYITVTVTNPLVVTPHFAPAKRVTINSEPEKLQFLADRAPLTGPVTLDWGVSTKHVLSAPASQVDMYGRLWVLGSWSFGGNYEAVYTVADAPLPDEKIIAKFVPGARASFLTEPNGLKLNIAGRDNWPSYNFVWPVGGKYTISAPAEQFDSSGRKWIFEAWSNGGPATQEVTMDPQTAETGFRLTAKYVPYGQVRVTSSPVGVVVRVDGTPCVTPCKLDRAPGSQVKISPPATIGLSEFSRLDFGGWGDGAALERTYKFSSNADVLSISYNPSHRLFLAADPPDSIDVKADPASSDGFYTAGAKVQVTAVAREGYKFRRWSGDLDTNFPSIFLSLSSPHLLTALADKIPYIPPAGIRNAAGVTPDAVVAPGSLIAITGLNLAPRSETGPDSPLVQTLAGTAVMLGDRILALVSASPELITALLPSDLPEGDYVVSVRPEGLSEVSGQVRVMRNAPGLFTNTPDERPLANALHSDGKPITPESPAKRGESITLLGTGFGPYDRPWLDGFALPPAPVFNLVDSLDLLAGDLVIQTEWVGGMAKQVGTAGVRFKVGADLPGGAPVELRIRINGRESNSVLLPLE